MCKQAELREEKQIWRWKTGIDDENKQQTNKPTKVIEKTNRKKPNMEDENMKNKYKK